MSAFGTPANTVETRPREASRLARAVPAALVGLGVLSLVSWAVEFAVFDLPAGAPAGQFVGEAALSLAVCGGFAFAAYWLRESDVHAARYPRILQWCAGVSVGFLVLNLVVMAVAPAATLEANVGWARGTLVFGALGGLVLGVVEARSIERAERAERATVRAEYADAQRQWLDYLNGLLRHEILNKATIVDGHAALIEESVDDPDALANVDVIRRKTDQMTDVIEDVRVLIESAESPEAFEPVNVSAVVRAETTDLRDARRSVTVNLDVPNDVYVSADALLSRVFSNLLRNAVEHNDSDHPLVSVSVTERADSVVVEVSDDGSGVPADVRDCLFERGENTGDRHGLGLYLVARLVERYDGDIELTETGPAGSTFTVTLPRADPPAGATEEREAVSGPLAA
ncbi:sensor histidine kinase [Salarchaeum japonicum]|uniref:histidine kinase n=1 Tax=Salarchaeum japonicum TaxID=555573 RepID=A0AAV3T0L7_9EURY|nr:HAMP domain-containing sensor histidine kinase [Salarchaeum japonicum]